MKIKTDFTPGPWKTEKGNIGFSIADYIRVPHEYEDGRLMHVSIGEKEYGWSTKESAANAKLIEAAPEMFELLFNIAQSIKNHPELSREIFSIDTLKKINDIGQKIS